MWSFAAPLALLLLPLPLMVRRLAPPLRDSRAAIYIPQGLADTAAPGEAGLGERWLRPVLLALLWAALVMALAGPQQTRLSGVVPASGRDIVLALDLSGSMKIEDFSLGGAPVRRLDAVKEVATRFVASRRGDRVGFVVFADRPYVAAPLSFDVDAVAAAIDAATIGISGSSTALAAGLGLAMKQLMEAGGARGVVILLSDGNDTSGIVDAREAARLAAGLGLVIYTVALGPDDLETAPDDRNAVDAATLRDIATESGGASFRVRTIADLEEMAAELDRLEPGAAASPPLLVTVAYWVWPAGLALGLAGLLGLMRSGT